MTWQWFPENASVAGHWVDDLFWLAFVLTVIAFVAVLGLLIYFLIRYRSRPGHKAYYTQGDSPKALALTLTLALIVFVAIDVNLAVHDHEAWGHLWKKPDLSQALIVKVMPEQFAWNAQYAGADDIFETPDDVKVINDLHVPVGRTVVVELNSKDVIHSFFLPNFRIKQDAVPGIVTKIAFEAKKTGVFEIACAEHCGLGHYRMRGTLTVETPEAFAGWLTGKGAPAPAA